MTSREFSQGVSSAPQEPKREDAGRWSDAADPFAGGMAYVPHAVKAKREQEPAPPPSPAVPPPSGAKAGGGAHDAPVAPHRRRRRARRRHGRRRLRPIFVIAGVVAVIGGIFGVGGGYGMVWLMRDSPLAAVMSPEEEAERETFLSACAQTLSSIDCACLWRDARAAFTPEYRSAMLRLIDERRELPIRLQRIRSEKLLGPELAKIVWDAAYYCSKR